LLVNSAHPDKILGHIPLCLQSPTSTSLDVFPGPRSFFPGAFFPILLDAGDEAIRAAFKLRQTAIADRKPAQRAGSFEGSAAEIARRERPGSFRAFSVSE
jgi:hypothetical protein